MISVNLRQILQYEKIIKRSFIDQNVSPIYNHICKNMINYSEEIVQIVKQIKLKSSFFISLIVKFILN